MIQDADPGDLPGSDLDDNSGRQPGQTPRKPEASHFRTEEPSTWAGVTAARNSSATAASTGAELIIWHVDPP
ncbi:MAG TPA: hypothetical protein VKP69_02490, partial [Isosphaeraceae bacterium]|nr:hypothetical protein [Isosphaeraceae bacterium]